MESRWERDIPHPSSSALGPTQPPVQFKPGLSLGQSGRGVTSTTLSTADVKERVVLTSNPSPPLGLRGLS